jgi:hypothetical protein
MIKLLNKFNNFSHSIIKKLVPSFSGMLRVKAGRPLISWFLKIILLVKGSITNSLVKVSISYVRTLYNMSRKNGVAYTAKYLKACVSLLMQALAGNRHDSSQVLGLAVSRTRKGIPRIIPSIHRKFIRSGSTFHIRLWLTLFSFYRVIDFIGPLKIKTIITPSKANIDWKELRTATESLMHQYGYNHFNVYIDDNKVQPFWIDTSSPNCVSREIFKRSDRTDWRGFEDFKRQDRSVSTSILSILGTCWAYGEQPQLRRYFLEIGHAFGYAAAPVFSVVSFSKFMSRYVSNFVSYGKTVSMNLNYQYLGKLCFKIEPAGKIRVFAMVDAFTQWALKPIHNQLFSFLRLIPEDATHDQGHTLSTFVERLRASDIKKVYSFDLTAATDRIPVSAQATIMSTCYKREIGSLWASLLTERWYQLGIPYWDPQAISCKSLGIDPSNYDENHIKIETDKKGNKYVCAVRYAAGQPMGALSSWAMLALTHHIMVRIAALRCNMRDFSFYVVLGDDLVIADKQVAMAYLQLAKEWDIEINLSKSVLSTNGSLEFAKRFFYKYQDVSGLSFREMAVAKYDIRGLLQLFNRINNFRTPRVSELLSFLGHGYKALSRMNTKYSKLGKGMRRALLLLSYPGLMFSTLSSVSSWLTSNAFNKAGHLIMVDDAINFLKDLGIKMADNIKQSDLPRNPDEFKEYFNSLWDLPKDFVPDYGKSDKINPDPMRQSLESLMMPLYYGIHESWDTTVVTVKDTFEFDEEGLDVDTIWSYLEELEDISSQASQASDFAPANSVITLGSSVLLKRADIIRSYFRSLTENKS